MKKKIISVLTVFLCIIGMSAQVPDSFQYQAVLRNADGSIASNEPLEVKIRIHQGSADGTVVFEEEHTTSSTASGIITLKVGEGSNTSRETLFVDIDWSSDVYFFETLVDRGTGFESLGSQQLLSVPYAKCAVIADNVHVKSPDGKLWKIKVSNDGTISAEAVTE